MPFNEFVKSKKILKATKIAAGVLILLLVFVLGVVVGLEKAQFSYRFNENYFSNFGRPKGPPQLFIDRDFMNARGAAGKILKIEGNIITTANPEGIEKNVVVSDDSAIKKARTDIKITDLKIGDLIVTIGSPTDKGEIQATLIRVIAPPPQ